MPRGWERMKLKLYKRLTSNCREGVLIFFDRLLVVEEANLICSGMTGKQLHVSCPRKQAPTCGT